MPSGPLAVTLTLEKAFSALQLQQLATEIATAVGDLSIYNGEEAPLGPDGTSKRIVLILHAESDRTLWADRLIQALSRAGVSASASIDGDEHPPAALNGLDAARSARDLCGACARVQSSLPLSALEARAGMFTAYRRRIC